METITTEMRKVLNPRLLVVRGVLSVAFGIGALIWPGPGLLAITMLYGAYAFVDGILALAAGVQREHRRQGYWGLPILQGIVGVSVGLIVFFRPGLALLALSIMVGVWAFLLGGLEIATAFQMRRASRSSRILLGLAGVLSMVLGGAIFASPPLGAVTLLTFIAVYSLVSGGLLVSMGVRLGRERAVRKGLEQDSLAA